MAQKDGNNKTFYAIGGTLLGLALLAAWYFGIYQPNKVVASGDGEEITNREYNNEAKVAINVLNQMKSLPDPTSKTEQPDPNKVNLIKMLLSSYPEIQGYIDKFMPLDTAGKAALILQGVGIALSKTRKPAIAARSIQEKRPIWLVIIDETFKNN